MYLLQKAVQAAVEKEMQDEKMAREESFKERAKIQYKARCGSLSLPPYIYVSNDE